jgi:hypothetical protein
MKKLYFFAIALFVSLATGAQTVNSNSIDIGAVDEAYTLQAIDVATTASPHASPLLWYNNPFKDQTFDTAEISFDVFNYGDIHVLGALLAFFDADSGQGRMYFTNGSYLGYNALGGWFDANLISYGIDSNFIGNNMWKNIRLQFTATGYAMYVDDSLAFDQSSSYITIAGTLADYSNVLTFLKKADTLLFGTGSWWSDNTDPDNGNYYDVQYSYLKNIFFITKDGGSVDSMNIDIGAVDEAFKPQAIDVAACVSPVASPALSYPNPFKNQTFDTAKISFDVYTYMPPDSIHVLGALFSIFDTAGSGRMYFTNGSYLGYNAIGGWFDANLISYGLGTDFIGTGAWRTIKLVFDTMGYALYVDDVPVYDQNSTDVTIAGTLTDYSNVITYLQTASSFIIGTGSWWSDNTRPGGSYYDIQYSYMKNITFTTVENPPAPPVSITEHSMYDINAKPVSEAYYSISGIRVGTDYRSLAPGIYIRKAIYSNGTISTTKIVKVGDL